MKKKIISLFSVIVIILTAISSNIMPSLTANAADDFDPSFITPSKKSLKDMFENLDKGSLTSFDGLVSWLTNRDDMVIVEYAKDWGWHIWLNVPNLQGIIYGKIDGCFACGYTESGVDMDAETKKSMYPTDSNGNTAMKQLGFNIPNIKYKGEYPIIEYSLNNVLPHGVWGAIKSAIKFLFGGSITEAPKTEDFATLTYVNLTDYIDDYAISRWLVHHWESTVSWFKSKKKNDQGLLPKDVCGNKESKGDDGKYYTVGTCIFAPGLDDPKKLGYDISTIQGASDFNKLLKTTWGQYYSPVITSIIYFSDGGEKHSLSDRSLRDMPYWTESIRQTGNYKLDLVKDPRCDSDAIFNIVHQRDKYFIKHGIYPTIISFFSKISLFTWFLDQLTDLDILEQNGVHIDVLWNNPAMKVILTLFLIFFVFHTSKTGIKIARGQASTKAGIGKVALGTIMCVLILGLIVSPKNTYSTFKKLIKFPETLAAEMFSDDTMKTFISTEATSDDKYDMSYWIPYYEMWAVYNTNHSLSEKSQIIDKNSGKTEVKEMVVDKIGKDDNTRWDLTLSYAFSSGYEVKRNAYRVVDHFLAPRFNVGVGQGTITTTENENYNGDIQSRVGANWIIILCLLVAEIVKLFLFINVAIQFALLIVFIVFKYRDEKFAETMKSFGFAYLLFFIATLFVPLVSNFTFYANSDFVSCTVLAVLYAIQLIGVIRWNSKRPDWMRPMLLVAIQKKKWRK